MNLENLPQLPQDKANHFLYGCGAAAVGAFLAVKFGVPPVVGALAGSIGAGAAKEAWDKVSKLGDPNLPDALATAAGALPVIAGLLVR